MASWWQESVLGRLWVAVFSWVTLTSGYLLEPLLILGPGAVAIAVMPGGLALLALLVVLSAAPSAVAATRRRWRRWRERRHPPADV